MHIKFRGTRALLYRSKWVAKGSCGNTHGYSLQQLVGTLANDAQTLPPEVASLLSKDETRLVEERVLRPARLQAQNLAKVAELRRADPIWRLDEAARLMREAAVLSKSTPVPRTSVAAIEEQLSLIKTTTPSQGVTSTSSPGQPKSDPLKETLQSIKTARDAVLAGRYGSAPLEGVRNTYVYRLWSQISESVMGGGDGSLLRALQVRGYAKTRSKSAR